jgi:hypothetical protein
VFEGMLYEVGVDALSSKMPGGQELGSQRGRKRNV